MDDLSSASPPESLKEACSGASSEPESLKEALLKPLDKDKTQPTDECRSPGIDSLSDVGSEATFSPAGRQQLKYALHTIAETPSKKPARAVQSRCVTNFWSSRAYA